MPSAWTFILHMIHYTSINTDFDSFDVKILSLDNKLSMLQDLTKKLNYYFEKSHISSVWAIYTWEIFYTIQCQLKQYDRSIFENSIVYINQEYDRKNNIDIHLQITWYFGDISDQNYEHLIISLS